MIVIAEPQPSDWDLRFRIGSIPVRVNPLFWFFTILPVLQDQPVDIVRAACWVAVVLGSILIHELGHALVAQRFGAQPWITIYAFGGLASYQPSGLSNRMDPTLRSILISFAGPGAGFALALLAMVALQVAGYRVELNGLSVRLDPRLADINPYLFFFMGNLVFVNIVWGVLNLIPVYPLDGGQILQAILTRIAGLNGLKQTLLTGILLGGLASFYGAFYLKSGFMAILFGYLAFQNFQILESVRHQRW